MKTYDIVWSTTKEYTCEGTIERRNRLTEDEARVYRAEGEAKGYFVICVGFVNP